MEGGSIHVVVAKTCSYRAAWSANWLGRSLGTKVGLWARPARWTHRYSRSPEICPGGFGAQMRRSFNASQRPPQPSQRDDLLFLFFSQDIAHVTERNRSARFNVPIQLSRWPVLAHSVPTRLADAPRFRQLGDRLRRFRGEDAPLSQCAVTTTPAVPAR